MSLDYTTYLGPYVECKVGRVPATKVEPKCATCGKINYNASYCPSCGGRITATNVSTDEDAVDVDVVRDLIQEELYFPSGDALHDFMREDGVHLWIPNVTRSREYISFYPKEEIRVDDISGGDVCLQIETFSRDFMDELAKMKHLYGDDNVNVKWGFIHEIS